jgi:hypothetical protein
MLEHTSIPQEIRQIDFHLATSANVTKLLTHYIYMKNKHGTMQLMHEISCPHHCYAKYPNTYNA